MKVKQIVGEHKKGVRAMKYTKKTKGTVPVYGPDSKDAKLKPVKPMEGIEVKPMPGASQVIGNDGKPIATTDAATAAVIKTAAEKGQFSADSGQETPVPETQEELGGDPTDEFIKDVTDQEWEQKAAHRSPEQSTEEGIFGFGNKSPEEWAKTSPQMAKLLQFRAKAVGTPYADQVEKRIQLLKDRLDMDAGEVAGPGGTPKDPVPPEQFNMNQLREADNALLEKMRTIAGLR
jgi:hypothetical protein